MVVLEDGGAAAAAVGTLVTGAVGAV